MRRIIKPVHILVHPEFYEKLEKFRKGISNGIGCQPSQMEVTQMMAKRIREPKFPKINILGGKNAKKKSRPY